MPISTRRVTLAAVVGLSAGAVGLGMRKRWQAQRNAGSVLVIGGTGLMGAPTVRRLLEQDRRVVIMTRGLDSGQGLNGQRPERAKEAESVVCDRTNTSEFVKMLSSPDCPRIVVDFAAMQPQHVEDVLSAHSVRALEQYIFISTNMVYPGGLDSMDISGLPQPVPESAADLSSAATAPDSYGGRKLKCEALLQDAFTSGGFPVTVLRPPAVVGPGCDDRHERLQRHVEGLPPKPPRRSAALAAQPGRFRVAFSEDVGAAIAAAVDRGSAVHGETFNIASEEELNMTEYVAAIAEAAGYASSPGAPEELSSRNYERQGSIDITKAKQVLGFQPTPLRQWMKETVLWHAPMLSREKSSAL